MRALAAGFLLLVSCSREQPPPPPLTECPPAPLDPRELLSHACALPDAGEPYFGKRCLYAKPVYIVGPYGDDDADGHLWRYDPCNGRSLFCQTGGVEIASGIVGCDKRAPPLCPPGLVEGATCTPVDSGVSPTNGECFVPANGVVPTGAPGEIIPGKACACDTPGPIWRCLSGTFRALP